MGEGTHWEVLADRPGFALDTDETRSVVFYLARRDGVGARRVTGWLHRFDEVANFVDRHGCLPRGRGEQGGEAALDAWLRRQRTFEANLCSFQRELLDGIPGFEWKPRDVVWEERFYAVADFLEERGRVPSHHSQDARERELGIWLRRQRRREREGTLTDERLTLWCQLGLESRRDGTIATESNPEPV